MIYLKPFFHIKQYHFINTGKTMRNKAVLPALCSQFNRRKMIPFSEKIKYIPLI